MSINEMSGHSKWANIKRKKEVKDATRSNVFTKMARLISSAVSEGGGITDPDKNFKLRLATERARAVNMPKDTIKRAIDKGVRPEEGTLHEVVYEAFGPGNVAFIITALTDNPNRTISEVRHALERNGGKLASQNAVSYLFQKCGIIEIEKTDDNESQVFAISDQLLGIDIEDTEMSYILYIPFENLGRAHEVLGTTKTKSLDVYYLALSPIEVGTNVYTKVEQLVEKLEDLDDVQGVYHAGIEG